ncbi:MAG: DUF1761 domain-containing protein [Alphaproteobacteria bacterium]
MAFAGVNYFAVLVAAIAGFAFGAVWYSTLSRQWLAAIGKTKAQLPGGAMPFVVAIVAQAVMATVLAGALGHLGPGNVTPLNGLISGAILWFGLVLTTMAVNHSFQGASRLLTLVDGLHWLGVLLVQGLVIGLFGG